MYIKVLVGLVIVVILGFVFIKNKTEKSVEVVDNSMSAIEENKESLLGAGEYSFDLGLSQIKWEGRKSFVENWIDTGSIALKSGNLTLENNIISKTDILIDMNSIVATKTGANGGEDKLATHLKSADFFDVTTFPISSFSLTSITAGEAENSYTIKGDITIKNITKNIEFPSVVYMSNENIYLLADIVIDRSQFDIRFGSPSFFNDIGDKAIDNNFSLQLKLVATK